MFFQNQHYHVLMPEVFRHLQELDEKRIKNIKNFMIHSVDIERKVFPIINQCLDGIIKASDQINEKEVNMLIWCIKFKFVIFKKNTCSAYRYFGFGWIFIADERVMNNLISGYTLVESLDFFLNLLITHNVRVPTIRPYINFFNNVQEYILFGV